MRDKDGIWLGVNKCRHWLGLDKYQEAECCGGRKFQEAIIKCGKKGSVKSAVCILLCVDRDEKNV